MKKDQSEHTIHLLDSKEDRYFGEMQVTRRISTRSSSQDFNILQWINPSMEDSLLLAT